MASDPLEERARLRVGAVLRGKYRLDRVLGVGGMAVVFKATHRNQAEFAIKMLHPELSLHEDIRNRFLREGYAANSVRHPGVVRIVDDDVAEDGAAFLVMELLDGVACDGLTHAGAGRLPLEVACSIALELLEVLAAAHAQGIIHRDIKPANLFLLRDGSLKVLDFGIARVRDTMGSGAHATGTGMLLGTPAFMAPEQAVGKASDIDVRADIWAVGATIFGLASGENIHDAETAAQLLVKLATQQPRSLTAVVPDAPPPVVAVVDRALALDKAQRWPAAAAMRDALGNAMQIAYGKVAPRALLASVVASQTGRPTPVSASWQGPMAAFPPTPPPGSRESGQRVASRAGPPLDVSTPPVVDTGRAGSPDRGTSRRRTTQRLVLGLVALAALASGVAVAFAVRGKKILPSITAVDTALSARGSAASSAATGASAPSAAPAPSASGPVADVGRADRADASAGEPAAKNAGKREEPPKREPAWRAPTRGGAGAAPVARPEPAGARQPAAPGVSSPASSSAAAADPLDGRR